MNRRFILLVLPFFIFLFSCHKSDDNNNSNTDISQGKWKVSLFTDSGNDETSDFSGYSFTFASGGVLTAQKGATLQAGTWSRGSDFTIDLGDKSDSNKPLGELTDNWKIISITSSEIKLMDDNASSGEFLTFTKN
ncbi:MAG: hypothetical protein WDO19_33565 [Bacteroidota bacterium]